MSQASADITHFFGAVLHRSPTPEPSKHEQRAGAEGNARAVPIPAGVATGFSATAFESAPTVEPVVLFLVDLPCQFVRSVESGVEGIGELLL